MQISGLRIVHLDFTVGGGSDQELIGGADVQGVDGAIFLDGDWIGQAIPVGFRFICCGGCGELDDLRSFEPRHL